MYLTGLLDALSSTVPFQHVVERLHNTEAAPDQGVIRSARPFVVAALAQALSIPTLVVTARVERAYDFSQQILAWLPKARVLRFQEPSTLFYEHAPWTSTTIRSRLQTLAALVPPIRARDGAELPTEAPPIIVSSAYALMQKTLPVRDFRVGSRQFHVRQQVKNLDELLTQWFDIGYEPTSVVTIPGTFSRRGGILDVFPPALELPVRIEFWGDEIDSLRTFDPSTQRSVANIQTFAITPAREALPKKLRETTWRHPEDSGSHGVICPEFYLPFLYKNAASLLDYLPEQTLVIVENWSELQDTVAELESQALEQRQDRMAAEQLPESAPVAYHTWDDISDHLVSHTPLHLGQPDTPFANPLADEMQTLGDLFSPGPRFGGQLRMFLDYLAGYHAEQSIVITRQAQRLAELWSEHGDEVIHPYDNIDTLADLPAISFVEGELSEGWLFENTDKRRVHVLTDAEIFGWKRPEPRRHIQKRTVSPETYFADLTEGDYVVHVDFGIGIFRGIQKRHLQNTEREYLLLEYGGNDILYVPIHQADRLTRYVGMQNRPPTLNRLGNQEWNKTKSRTKEAVEEVAEELLALYAARNVIEGHAYSPDSPWQHELEASFPFVETPDQLQALREIKTDMESPTPMDRLICGDAGYGKTEVALRAAFKAVMDGKQVAVLVPTTVLAQQHYNTFSQRLVAFPIKVQMLSRFRSPAEQREIITDTAQGRVDILIGTHRMLQEDVSFHNLGLLVIDEEQRFGVTHKERLKKMRTEVDVLTMTATPIPRTLYMGLTGLRDISLIQTAPEERLAPLTHVGAYDDKLIRQAILREIDRGGQVFFVHNRVQTIYTIADRLRRLVPEATFAVGHGQMEEHQLEGIMKAFAEGEKDVLVSTTIIENGIDIPNANTIIIDRADRFGLSQLYQLRGRVGRSAQQSYVYFFHPRHQPLTPDARARLETISEYTQLGVGMSIAMRDLEIRGTGDLLGVQQSGYIDAVGFTLYTQLLSDAVLRLSGKKPQKPQPAEAEEQVDTRTPVTIDLPVPAYIPTDFLDDMALRLQLYRRLASIKTEQDLDGLDAELKDRFGKLPLAIQGLLYQMRVKLLGQQAGATAISTDKGRVQIRLPYLGSIDRTSLQDYLGEQARVSRTAVWLVPDVESEGWQQILLEMLKRLQREQANPGMY